MAYVVLRNIGTKLAAKNGFYSNAEKEIPYAEREVISNDIHGAALAKLGLAEVYEPQQSGKVHGVAPKPAIAEAKASDIKGEAKK